MHVTKTLDNGTTVYMDCCIGAKSDLILSSWILATRLDLWPNETAWQMKCIYVEFWLNHEYGEGGFLDTLRIGSCDLHNDRATLYEVVIGACKQLLEDAEEHKLDLIEVDLNLAASTHSKHPTEDSSFLAAMRAHMGADFILVPAELLGIIKDDCTGFIVPRPG